MKFLSNVLKLWLLFIYISLSCIHKVCINLWQILYIRIYHPIFMEPRLIRQYLNIFTKIVRSYTQKSYFPSDIYVPCLICQDLSVFTNIVRSYTQRSYSSFDLYVPWLMRQDPMILLFESYFDSSVSIQLIYCLAYWFDIVSQNTPLKPELDSSILSKLDRKAPSI